MPDLVGVALQFVRLDKSEKVCRADISCILRWSGLKAGEFVS